MRTKLLQEWSLAPKSQTSFINLVVTSITKSTLKLKSNHYVSVYSTFPSSFPLHPTFQILCLCLPPPLGAFSGKTRCVHLIRSLSYSLKNCWTWSNSICSKVPLIVQELILFLSVCKDRLCCEGSLFSDRADDDRTPSPYQEKFLDLIIANGSMLIQPVVKISCSIMQDNEWLKT